MTTVKRPNLQHELSRLKDFQRDTVEYVYSRMYDEAAPSRRFLVADEVGLGKTMVARGVVAKVVDRLWDDVDRIDVIYICSNGSIARQNINRLNITEAKDASLPSRITLLPTVVHGLKERKLNFISLTPQTSFDLKSSLGRFEERALLYWLLPGAWKKDESAVRNLLQGEAGRDAFRRRVAEFEHEHIDEGLRSEFHKQLEKHSDLHAECISTADRFQTWRKGLPPEDRSAQRALIGRLRLELAISCLGALEPDLIILDEFQRFKHLLDGTDQAGDLARELFDFGDARVLLLSATPYKMTRRLMRQRATITSATSCKRLRSYRRIVSEPKDSENRSRPTGTVSLRPLQPKTLRGLSRPSSALRPSCGSLWSERNDLP